MVEKKKPAIIKRADLPPPPPPDEIEDNIIDTSIRVLKSHYNWKILLGLVIGWFLNELLR